MTLDLLRDGGDRRRDRELPRVSPGPCKTRTPSLGQSLQEERRSAEPERLGPEQREDRELEVVGLATEQLTDTVELPVGEAEYAMKGLFGDRAQKPQLSLASDPHSWRCAPPLALGR